MKKIIITLVSTVIAGIVLFMTFRAGAVYGMYETADIYGNGLYTSMGTLEVGETSTEYHLDFNEFGIDEEISFQITRTK